MSFARCVYSAIDCRPSFFPLRACLPKSIWYSVFYLGVSYGGHFCRNFGRMRVFVYFNLHKKLWSIKDLKTGKVIGRIDSVYLQDCEMKVSQAGRKRVLKEKRKNVHAGIVGTWDYRDIHKIEGTEITYNPYKYESFVNKETLAPVYKASEVYMQAITGKSPVVTIK